MSRFGKRGKSNSPRGGLPPPEQPKAPRRATYLTERLTGYERSLSKLDKGPEIQATVDSFVRDWRQDLDLTRWNYKLVGKFGVRQIHVLRNFRVWLVEVTQPPPRLIFLEVARKVGSKKTMQGFINVAQRRAQPYWRQDT